MSPRWKAEARGRRQFDGALLDVDAAATLLGCSARTLRARVARRLVPFRRFGGRIVFLRKELLSFCERLDGCTAQEARANLAARTQGPYRLRKEEP